MDKFIQTQLTRLEASKLPYIKRKEKLEEKIKAMQKANELLLSDLDSKIAAIDAAIEAIKQSSNN